jgi:hypothetical protein
LPLSDQNYFDGLETMAQGIRRRADGRLCPKFNSLNLASYAVYLILRYHSLIVPVAINIGNLYKKL